MGAGTERGEARRWHAMTGAEVFSALGSGPEGLSGKEAERRRQEHGSNTLPEARRPSAWRRLLRQFANTLIYVLLVAAAFTAYLREWADLTVILAVVVLNALIGFLQEGKAERAMESIRGMLTPTATALRDGDQHELEAAELVPGDIVVLSSGDRVPADLRVIQVRNGRAQEAALTGESAPVPKQCDPVEASAALGDRASMAFSGTVVSSGQLRGVVVATGGDTEIGGISAMVEGVQTLRTPLLRRIDAFGRKLSLAIVVGSVAFFAVGYFLRGFSGSAMFMAMVGLAVAAIPEGLPPVMTIALARGVQGMARHRAIVRRLPAVETLGSVTVICSDKTGTLTRNEMTIARVIAAGQVYQVTGIGYAPEGVVRLQDQAVSAEEHPWLLELGRAGLLTSDARVQADEAGSGWTVEGDPTEAAAVVLARKVGLRTEEELEQWRRLDVRPFESEQRFMASLHRQPQGGQVIYLKGAPERVLAMCSRQRTRDGEEPLDRAVWEQHEAELADSGHRVLAIAAGEGRATLEEPELQDLTLLGLVGIIDPPREEAIAAVAQCRRAGIRVKMITGDHLLTARSIGAAVGIGDGQHAVSGRELEQAEGAELERLVRDTDVFARASPEHKLRIVEALQADGQVVAMTGDGVNDAPALKRADVGVAMGLKGTEATKEAADMVLADDNFATIERAVESGRAIYDNLIKTILFLLPTSAAESLMVIAGVLIMSDMPITPIQILWVNLVTAVTLGLALAFEPPEPDIMTRPARSPDQPIISGYLVWRTLFVSVLIAVAASVLFSRRLSGGASVELARTLAINSLVAGQLFYLFNTRFLNRSSIGLQTLLGNRPALLAAGLLVALQLAFTYLGVSHRIFGTASLVATDWAAVLAVGLGVFLAVEAEKGLLRFRQSRAEPAPEREPQRT